MALNKLSSQDVDERLARSLERAEDRAVLELARHYLDAAALLETMVQSFQPNRTWLETFVLAAQPVFTQLAERSAATALRAAQRAYLTAYYVRLWTIWRAARADAPLVIEPPPSLDTLLKADVYDDLISSLLGRDFTAQFADQIDLLIPEIKLTISQGMSAGEGIPDIMRRVRTTMGLQTDRRRGPVGSDERKGYRRNFNRVQVITRTVVNQASNTGAYEAYQRNADVLSGYQWSASPSRVCDDCLALDGTIYPLSDTTRPPKHPNCRCAIKPVLDPRWQPEVPVRNASLSAFMHQLDHDASPGLIDW